MLRVDKLMGARRNGRSGGSWRGPTCFGGLGKGLASLILDGLFASVFSWPCAARPTRSTTIAASRTRGAKPFVLFQIIYVQPFTNPNDSHLNLLVCLNKSSSKPVLAREKQTEAKASRDSSRTNDRKIGVRCACVVFKIYLPQFEAGNSWTLHQFNCISLCGEVWYCAMRELMKITKALAD